MRRKKNKHGFSLISKAWQREAGFSLLEVLVVVALFAFLSIITTRSLADILRNTRKSENILDVRADLGVAMSLLENSAKGKTDISCSLGDLLMEDSEISEPDDQWSVYRCGVVLGANGLWYNPDYLGPTGVPDPNLWEMIVGDYSGINISCIFTCIDATPRAPAGLNAELTATDTLNSGEEGATIVIESRINLRVY